MTSLSLGSLFTGIQHLPFNLNNVNALASNGPPKFNAEAIAGPGQPTGRISAKFEAIAEDPGTVSSGKGDPGGVSYGLYQMASRKGIPQAFVKSADCAKWAHEFKGLTPGTPAFSAAWKSIAAREPKAFGEAQYKFIRRENYDRQVNKLKADLDFNTRSLTIKEVVWSSGVQSGGAWIFWARPSPKPTPSSNAPTSIMIAS